MNECSKTKPKFSCYNNYLEDENGPTFGNSNKTTDRFHEKRMTEVSSSTNPLSEIDNLDLKIRKEREEMEKKIKEKMLYRKIEVASSPDRHRLRE